jgi:hypothetical protein
LFLHQPESRRTPLAPDLANESESEGSGLIENLFGFKVLRNPPSG